MSPHLSRTSPEDYVEGRRRILYSAIFGRPGISFTELQEEAKIRLGVLQYHLETLERTGFVESVKVGRYRRYYPVGLDHHEALKIRAHAADPHYLKTLVEVETLPGVTGGQLHKLHPGVTRQAVVYRLDRLERVGAVQSDRQGRRRQFALTPEAARILEAERAAGRAEGHCPSEPDHARDARRCSESGDAIAVQSAETVPVPA